MKKRLTLVKVATSHPCKPGSCNPLILTLKNPRPEDAQNLVKGSYETAKDPLGYIAVAIELYSNSKENDMQPIVDQIATNVTDLTMAEVLEIETGFVQKNNWVDWVESAARTLTKKDCIVCSASRPALLMVLTLVAASHVLGICV